MAVVQGQLTGTGQSASFEPDLRRMGAGGFNFSLWGTFVGTVALERSFDSGTTWLPITALGSAITFTGPCSEVFDEPSGGVQYRVNCTAYTSGTINYRMSQ